MDSLDRRIEEIRKAEERVASEHLWQLHCDVVRKREKERNYEAIKQAVQTAIERVKAKLPGRRMEFSENPAGSFTARNPSPFGATVTVTMSQDGAALEIAIQRHVNPPGVISRNVVRVEIEGDDSYFRYEGNLVTPTEVANLVLVPCL